ncbi:MAG: rhodanese-like domain-containing protein [Rhodobacteraceae bacterium]|nr:rhodanese-like domain-containing protein [Paracoccaceae bacterium]
MSDDTEIDVTEVSPVEAWKGLASDDCAVLVDVRTKSEWSYVGGPDLDELDKQVIRVEWLAFPDMAVNQGFAGELFSRFGDKFPPTIYFLCRSGVRSLDAADFVLEAAAEIGRNPRCVNVSEGFEGDLDENRQRGHVNGWKKHGLPWRQT